jgi:hypothetical protein
MIRRLCLAGEVILVVPRMWGRFLSGMALSDAGQGSMSQPRASTSNILASQTSQLHELELRPTHTQQSR